MSIFNSYSVKEQIASLFPLAEAAANSYGWGDCQIESINHEFNSTFKITTAVGKKYALRINVNSLRSEANVRAELFWVKTLNEVEGLRVAKPISNLSGEFLSFYWHEEIGKDLATVAFEWIDGKEIGDTPSIESLKATGAAMARMHEASLSTKLPNGTELNTLQDALWGARNNISTDKDMVVTDKAILQSALDVISELSDSLFKRETPQIIHADLHGWNLMWNGHEVTVFDFDDCAIGLPVQDLAVTFYYLDIKEHENYIIEGYESVRPLPIYSQAEMATLIMQRRLILLNYLLETRNPEHRAMVPKYLANTVERTGEFLAKYGR